jgi:hypothetical protein
MSDLRTRLLVARNRARAIPVEPLLGKVFGRLKAIKASGKNLNGSRLVFCVCQCGKKVKIPTHALISGKTKSCGCFRDDSTAARCFKHGFSSLRGGKAPEYLIWIAMKKRCLNPRDKDFKHYGGRGIKVCKRWIVSFSNFINDLGRRPSKRHWLERKNNSLGYSPKNCKWATIEEQALNTRRNRRIIFNGRNQALSQWSFELKIHRTTIATRLNRGLSVEKALSPVIYPIKKS